MNEGVLDWSYTGLTKYYSTWYMVVNGQLDWNYNDVTYYYGTWYYVKNGKLNWNYTGLAYHAGGWYYVDHGRINWDYTGLCQYNGSWYMVVNGQIDWSFTNLTEYYGTWYYVENGKLNWNFTDLFQYYSTWYCIRGGKLDWNYTGLAYHAGGWYYINHGVLDWNYSGYAQVNGKGEYYEVKNGVMVKGTLDKMRAIARNESSPTKYLIIVDRAACRVGIFNGSKGNWSTAQFYTCCVGKASTPTVSGTYYVGGKGKYFDTGTRGRCWYYTQITGNYLFHSVIYDRQNSPNKIIDNAMGKAVSHGCVRLDIDHAKWIYDNVPKNSKIIIY